MSKDKHPCIFFLSQIHVKVVVVIVLQIFSLKPSPVLKNLLRKMPVDCSLSVFWHRFIGNNVG